MFFNTDSIPLINYQNQANAAIQFAENCDISQISGMLKVVKKMTDSAGSQLEEAKKAQNLAYSKFGEIVAKKWGRIEEGFQIIAQSSPQFKADAIIAIAKNADKYKLSIIFDVAIKTIGLEINDKEYIRTFAEISNIAREKKNLDIAFEAADALPNCNEQVECFNAYKAIHNEQRDQVIFTKSTSFNNSSILNGNKSLIPSSQNSPENPSNQNTLLLCMGLYFKKYKNFTIEKQIGTIFQAAFNENIEAHAEQKKQMLLTSSQWVSRESFKAFMQAQLNNSEIPYTGGKLTKDNLELALSACYEKIAK